MVVLVTTLVAISSVVQAMRTARILVGDVREKLRDLPDQSVQCVVTSPPYFGLRDYGDEGQIGLESSPADYIAVLVATFAQVRRVLRADGVVWLNLGDSYAGSWGAQGRPQGETGEMASRSVIHARQIHAHPKFGGLTGTRGREMGLKPKDLMMIPARVAIALQEDGWYLRSDVIWSKPNPMPERVTDRPTKAHEYIFLLTKSERYFYDADAIKEPYAPDSFARYAYPFGEGNKSQARLDQGLRTTPIGMREYKGQATKDYDAAGAQNPSDTKRRILDSMEHGAGRNKRTVWTVTTQPYEGAHFATYPEALIEPCILAGTSECGQCPQCGSAWERVVEREPSDWAERKAAGEPIRHGLTGAASHGAGAFAGKSAQTLGWQPSCTCNAGEPTPQVVLDPFCGSGTTGVVACRHNRHFIGIELNASYARLAEKRILDDAGLLNRVEVVA
jgi:DNA modification methylase